MILIQMQWSGEALVTGLGVIVTLGAQQWWMHKENTKAMSERDRQWRFVLGEHPPHTHTETDPEEPLRGKNIRFPHVRINGNSGDR